MTLFLHFCIHLRSNQRKILGDWIVDVAKEMGCVVRCSLQISSFLILQSAALFAFFEPVDQPTRGSRRKSMPQPTDGIPYSPMCHCINQKMRVDHGRYSAGLWRVYSVSALPSTNSLTSQERSTSRATRSCSASSIKSGKRRKSWTFRLIYRF